MQDLSARWSAHGITGVTDATPDHTVADLETLGGAHLSGELRQRVHAMAPAEVGPVPGVSIGPAKRILDDATLDLDALQHWIATTHAAGRAVAVHCVTVSQLVVTIAALRGAGVAPGDRIEHAAMVPDDCIADLAALGITVVTQPNFVAERGDQYLAEVPVDEQGDLWRVASLMKGWVRVALSTDSPFGDGDPWAAMRAAVRRETPSGVILGAGERISASTALTMFLGHAGEPTRRRTLAPGQSGDVCVLSLRPRDALAELDADMVAATVIGGKLVYTSDRSVR
jgi:predicted amidohydrolase YtcJ